MNVKEFDQLLKRVNLEENTDIKKEILSVISKYIDVISVDKVDLSIDKVLKVETEMNEAEAAVEDIVQVVPVEEPKTVGVAYVEDEVKETPEEVQTVEEVTVQVDSERPALPLEEPTVKMNQDHAVPTFEEVVEEEKVVVSTKATEEIPESEELPAIEKADEPTEYVEEFGLISTTNEESHLKQIIERGGVLFREKRSFMLMLCLDDELVAIAKTAKLEQFPQEVQEHMKSGGFVSCDIVSFSEITKRSRARYTNVSYKNLQLLEKDHWIVKNVTNLLEKGEVPEHAKPAEKTAEEEVVPSNGVSERNVDEKPYLVSTFLIHPGFVDTFKNQKEAILSQQYGITSADGVARFFTRNANGQDILIGVDEKTPLKENQYLARIIDYTMKELDGKTHVQFKLDADIVQETVQPAPDSEPVSKEEQPTPEPKPERANVGLKSIGEVPADFPKENKLEIQLHPQAEAMFNPELAQGMVGQALSLGMVTRKGEDPTITLIHDVFEMGYAKNNLTTGPMRDSKWAVRLTKVEIVESPETKRKFLTVEFDSVLELEAFPHESKSETLDILSFIPITEESYAARQRDIAQKREIAQAATTQPVVAPSTPEEAGQEKASAEDMLNKDIQPGSAEQLTAPNPTADYSQAYNDLVNSQSKDMGGAVQELKDKTALNQQNRSDLMGQAQGMISGVITQTLKETGIHTKTEEKQTTSVVGNLQDGAGNLSQTETVINFATGYTPQSWASSVGKQIQLRSELQFGNGPVTMKTVSMIGKNNVIVGQGQVPMTEALLLDGNQHTATLLGIENAVQENQGYVVSLRLGQFKAA